LKLIALRPNLVPYIRALVYSLKTVSKKDRKRGESSAAMQNLVRVLQQLESVTWGTNDIPSEAIWNMLLIKCVQGLNYPLYCLIRIVAIDSES